MLLALPCFFFAVGDALGPEMVRAEEDPDDFDGVEQVGMRHVGWVVSFVMLANIGVWVVFKQ